MKYTKTRARACV